MRWADALLDSLRFFAVCLVLSTGLSLAHSDHQKAVALKDSQHFASAEASASSDIAVRLDRCRAQLKDLEKFRGNAQRLGNLELFEGLFSHAQRVLDQIDGQNQPTAIYLLLGECQGILDSLIFSLNLSKYGKRQKPHQKGPPSPPSRPTNRQVTTNPNISEPLPTLKKEGEEDGISQERQSILHFRSPSGGRTASKRHASPIKQDSIDEHIH